MTQLLAQLALCPLVAPLAAPASCPPPAGFEAGCEVRGMTNGGFELPIDAQVELPAAAGGWRGGPGRSTGPAGGLSPEEGSSMWAFGAGRPLEASPRWKVCPLWQLVVPDDDPHGRAAVTATAAFNAAAWSGAQGPAFLLGIYAYAGEPGEFPSQSGGGELASAQDWVFADADAATWETARVRLALPPGTGYVAVMIAAAVADDDSPARLCAADDVRVSVGAPGVRFLRGDVDGDGLVAPSDLFMLVAYLFGAAGEPACLAAADADDNGTIDISDAAALLRHLYGEEKGLPAPFPDCGEDPTPDRTGCRLHVSCEIGD